MKAIDIFTIAIRGLRKGWTIVPLIGIVFCTICFSFAGAIGFFVYTEKQEPCELTVMASGNNEITDQTIVDILAIHEVTAATAVLSIPVTVETGNYDVDINLLGLDGNYLNGNLSIGGIFPSDTVMPYIVLNEAACKQFSSSGDEVPDIDWMNESFSVQMGEGTKAVTSRVCGILSEDDKTEQDQNPAGYIDLTVAKALQRTYQLPTDYTSAIVRIKNIGCARNVERQIASLGYEVVDSNTELQEKWEALESQMFYLIIIGAIGLICFSLLMAATESGNLVKQRSTLSAMRWLGMPISALKDMLFLQTALVGIIGVVIGIALDYTIPSFIPIEQQTTSVFSMQVPFWIALAVGLLNVCIFLLPAFYASKQIKKVIV